MAYNDTEQKVPDLLEATVKRRCLFFLFGLTSALLINAQDRFVPHVTTQDSDFQTWIILENLGTEAEGIQMTAYAEDGSRYPFSLQGVEPGETQTHVVANNILHEFVSHFTIGSDAYPSTNIRLTFVYGLKDGNGSRVHVPQMTTTAKAWRFYTGNWPTVYDAVAVVNFGDASAEIKVIQRASDGSVIKEVVIAESAPSMSKTRYVIGGNSSEFDGSASSIFEVRSNQPLGLIALQGNLPDSTIMWINTAQALPAEEE